MLFRSELSDTFPAGAVVQHAIADPDIPVIYAADFDSVASGTGAVRKLVLDSQKLLLYREGASGRQAHLIGLGPLVRPPVVADLLVVQKFTSTYGVQHYRLGAWVDATGDLIDYPWRGIVARDANEWIVWGGDKAYITLNAGVNWTELTDIADGRSLAQALGFGQGIMGAAYSSDGTWAIVGSGGAFPTEAGFITVGSGTTTIGTADWVSASSAGAGTPTHSRPQEFVWVTAARGVSRNSPSTAGSAQWLDYEWLEYNVNFNTLTTDETTSIDARPNTANVYGVKASGDILRSPDLDGPAVRVMSITDATMLACAEALYVASPAGLTRVVYDDVGEADVVLSTDPAIFVRADRQQRTAVVALTYDGDVTYALYTYDGNGWAAVPLPPNGGAAFGVAGSYPTWVEVIAT